VIIFCHGLISSRKLALPLGECKSEVLMSRIAKRIYGQKISPLIHAKHVSTGRKPQDWTECSCTPKTVREYFGIDGDFVHLVSNLNKFGFNVHVPVRELTI